MTTRLDVGVFTRPVLFDVARRIGAFAAAGLDVREHPVGSSPDQFRRAFSGEFDAILTNPDNTLAYHFDSTNPLATTLAVEIVAGIDRGLGLTLCAHDDRAIHRRRPRVGVDAATSGFALLAYALLEQLGIARDDIEIVTLGSTPRRAVALAAGDCDITILNAGNELVAHSRGCVFLASSTDVGPYIGTVLARVEPSARAEDETRPQVDEVERDEAVVALRTVLLETTERIVSGDVTDLVVDSASGVLGLTDEEARRHAEILRDDNHGLIRGGTIDSGSMETIISLRERYAPSMVTSMLRAGWTELLASPPDHPPTT